MEKKLKPDNTKKRREFIKKVAYSAPTILALGTLVKPTASRALPPISDPNYCNSKLEKCPN